ncbi:11884_t:CDS:2, partial [Funneliformis geosporum]
DRVDFSNTSGWSSATFKVSGTRESVTERMQNENAAEDTNQGEDLPSVDTTGLLERVRAAIYLSLDELWSVLTDNALIATFLDPKFKHFNWTTNDEQEKAY